MRTRRVRLPTGVALLQVELASSHVVLISRDLDPTQARVARDAADVLASKGYVVIVLTVADIEAAMIPARRRTTSTLAKGRPMK